MGNLVQHIGEQGQITIPKEIREHYNINAGDEITFVERNGNIVIKPEPTADTASPDTDSDS